MAKPCFKSLIYISVLEIGTIIFKRLEHHRLKLRKLAHFLLILGISLAMSYQLMFSVLKYLRFPTESNVQYKEESPINCSITFCSIVWLSPELGPTSLLQLNSIYKQEDENNPWVKFHDEETSNSTNLLIWQACCARQKRRFIETRKKRDYRENIKVVGLFI